MDRQKARAFLDKDKTGLINLLGQAEVDGMVKQAQKILGRATSKPSTKPSYRKTATRVYLTEGEKRRARRREDNRGHAFYDNNNKSARLLATRLAKGLRYDYTTWDSMNYNGFLHHLDSREVEKIVEDAREVVANQLHFLLMDNLDLKV